ncbi:MAG: alpha-L-fucosidase, partial [Chloroflexi bacterium]|nr:alpha-L-fucosidase [Chloroflexota bacterium]
VEISVIWFDGQWERSIDPWRAKELREMILGLQPGIMINDRLPGQGGYATPEQFVPPQPLPGPWETCLTMNETWAYNPDDTRYKSARSLIHRLCEIAGKGGNLLLNVGPRDDGTLPPEQTERLEAIAAWMARNAESIVGTETGLEAWQFYGPSTRRGETVYLHLRMRPHEDVSVRGVRVKRVKSVRALATGKELRFTTRMSIADTLFNPDPLGELAISLPEASIDEMATVIAVELAPEPIAPAS